MRLLLVPLLLAACAGPGLDDPPSRTYAAEAAGIRPAAGSPTLPDAATIRAIFNKNILHLCDELTCSYLPARLFRVEAVSCRRLEHGQEREEVALCTYERQLIPRHGAPRPWRQARSRFHRHIAPDGTPAPWTLAEDLTRGRD